MKHIKWLWILLAFMCLPLTAQAHTRSESHSSWQVNGGDIRMTFTVADLEARRLTRDGQPPSDTALLAYLTPRLGVTAGQAPCALTTPPLPIMAASGYRRFEFAFKCLSGKNLVLHSRAFFEFVPTHTNFAQIQTPDGRFVEQLMTKDQMEIALDSDHGNLADAGFLTFMRMGIMHIFTGVDHMSFLVGLVLISRRLKDLTFVVTGFTLGHSLTLALAVTGIIRPHAEYIDALVALTIALIGIENLGVQSGKVNGLALATGGALLLMGGLRLLGIGLLPPLLLIGAALFAANYLFISGHLRDAGRLRLVVTLVFGLIHGFGFAADLLESRIPRLKLGELLLGFNLGVEVGQLTIVLLLAASVWLLTRLKLTLPRPLVTDVLAAALIGIGTFWFVGRSF